MADIHRRFQPTIEDRPRLTIVDLRRGGVLDADAGELLILRLGGKPNGGPKWTARVQLSANPTFFTVQALDGSVRAVMPVTIYTKPVGRGIQWFFVCPIYSDHVRAL